MILNYYTKNKTRVSESLLVMALLSLAIFLVLIFTGWDGKIEYWMLNHSKSFQSFVLELLKVFYKVRG